MIWVQGLGALLAAPCRAFASLTGVPWPEVPAGVTVYLQVFTVQGVSHVLLHRLRAWPVLEEVVHEGPLQADAEVELMRVAVPAGRALQHGKATGTSYPCRLRTQPAAGGPRVWPPLRPLSPRMPRHPFVPPSDAQNLSPAVCCDSVADVTRFGDSVQRQDELRDAVVVGMMGERLC